MSIGRFQPFWLNEGGRRLYAAIHDGNGASSLSVGRDSDPPAVLILPPLLHEYHRSFRFLCELASGLADAGLPCLRFCHYGSGDSEGEGDQADFDTMAADIDHAMQMLVEHTGRRRIVILAFRSAALSLQHWLARGKHAGLVVLWDPILDGAAWLEGLRAQDEAKRATIRAEVDTSTADGELMGCLVSSRFLDQLERSTWRPESAAAATQLWVVGHDGGPAPTQATRRFALPTGTPSFGEGVLMDASLFFPASMHRFTREIGTALAADSVASAA
jgi:hypothetical protein